jgi:hypothetical protein
MNDNEYSDKGQLRGGQTGSVRMPRPTVVCLCGSTRFGQAFRDANLQETLDGKIVLTIGCDMRSDAELFADKSPQELQEIKHRLDILHLRKIDMADEVLILNVSGYIGESTRRELDYAVANGKRVRWLEPEHVPELPVDATKTRFMKRYERMQEIIANMKKQRGG